MVKLNPCKEIKLNEYVKFNYEIIVGGEVVGFIYGQTNVIGCHLSLIYVNDKKP
jgi:site-specific recombinase